MIKIVVDVLFVQRHLMLNGHVMQMHLMNFKLRDESIKSKHIGPELNIRSIGNFAYHVFIFNIVPYSSTDRSLLYIMRMWVDIIDVLHIASGTIYNEILVWKVVVWYATPCLNSSLEDSESVSSSFGSELLLSDHQYEAVPVCRLAGHEGSIIHITWSSDGSKLVSVSDDRSARIWEVHDGKRALDYAAELVVSPETGPVLFGHIIVRNLNKFLKFQCIYVISVQIYQ